MAAPSELARLELQRDEAADRLDALLEAREAALEGRGIAPSAAEIDRARAALEVAEGILATYCRTEGAA
jgi:hypothetical protein